MDMTLGMDTRLHGQLVGIGKVRTDGSEEFDWLDKPVHNKIVQTGIDGLLEQDGDSTVFANVSGGHIRRKYMWAGEDTAKRRCGVLQYCAWGTGTSATTFNMTELENRVSPYTSTKKTGSIASNYYCGTIRVSQGKYRLRISHVHAAAAEDATVTEVGWFQRIAGGDTYRMFSRVKLLEPYTVLAGEQLITTYEVVLTLGGTTTEHIDDFFGLKDTDGNPLQADVKLQYCGYNLSSGDYSASPSFPCIGWDGAGTVYSDDYGNWEGCGNHIPAPYCIQKYSYENSYGAFALALHSTSATKDFVAYDNFYGCKENTSTISEGGAANAHSWSILPHEPGTNYRDIVFSEASSWPYLSNPETSYADIRYLLLCGYGYRFGYWEDDGAGGQVWHSQAFRKRGDMIWRITVRFKFTTSDTE